MCVEQDCSTFVRDISNNGGARLENREAAPRAIKHVARHADDGRMKGFMRVSVGIETTAEEIQALEQVFRLAEIPVLVEDEIARFSVDSPWVMYLSAPLVWFSSRFVRLPEDAPPDELGPGLGIFIQETRKAFKATDGSVVFTDERTEVQVALTSELPQEALGKLLAVDFGKVEGERISWDGDHLAWYTLRGEPCPVK